MKIPFFSKAKQTESQDLAELFNQLFGQITFGLPIGRPTNYKEYLDKSYLYNVTVYSIVRKIINKSKNVPFVLYEVKDKKAFRQYHNIKDLKLKEQALEEIALPELEAILKQPNPETTFNELLEQYLINSLILGNHYLYKVQRPTATMEAIQLWTIPAQIVEIVAGPNFMQPVGGYRCATYWGTNIIDKSKIIHFRKQNPNYNVDGSHLYGLSPISNAATALTLDNNAINAHLSAFLNSGVRGILGPGDNNVLQKHQAEELKDRYKQHKGLAKFNDLFISAINLKYTPLGLSPVDLAIIESQKMTLKDLCNIYGVPIQIMNSSEASTYSNVKEAMRAMMYDAVLPELDAFYEKMNNTFIKDWSLALNKQLYLGYDIQAIQELQEDMNTLAGSLEASSFLTINEKRAALGYGEIPDELANEVMLGGLPLSQFTAFNLDAEMAQSGGQVYDE